MNRLTFPAAALLLTGALTLSSCGDDAETPAGAAGDGSGAVGEVEGGTINDDMLPLESVTSKAPTRGGSDADDSGADGGDDAADGDGDEAGPDEDG